MGGKVKKRGKVTRSKQKIIHGGRTALSVGKVTRGRFRFAHTTLEVCAARKFHTKKVHT